MARPYRAGAGPPGRGPGPVRPRSRRCPAPAPAERGTAGPPAASSPPSTGHPPSTGPRGPADPRRRLRRAARAHPAPPGRAAGCRRDRNGGRRPRRGPRRDRGPEPGGDLPRPRPRLGQGRALPRHHPGFTAEQYPPGGRGDQDGARLTYFGGVRQPFSGRFLLYSAAGWDTGGRATPVLLVHGANDNADRAWADPGESGSCGATGPAGCPSTGLAQYLAATGHRVFAIGFAHKHGDNLLQAQAVGDAVALIRARLGVPQVDVVAWSKGEVAARAYVSSVRPSWGRAYAGDVRRLVTLGGPNGGLDYVYAHGWAFSLATWPACGGTANAPPRTCT
ncbi:esterase/lipase family protein [Kitasatospora aburaviensis]